MKELMQSLCDKAKKQGADFADIRIYSSESTSILRQDEKADKLSQSNNIGIGVRVLKDHSWGFASASSFDKDVSQDLVDWAINMASASKGKTEEAIITEPDVVNDIVSAKVEIDPRSVSIEDKIKKLEEFEKAAIDTAGNKLENIMHNYVDNISKEIICNSYGTYIETETIRTIVLTHIVVSDGRSRQRGYVRLGKPIGFELLENINIEDFSVKAANKAIRLLSADMPPAGKFPVIFHPSITGLLTHEALGHNAEADSVLNNTSIIGDKLNQKIASELINIIDDSTYPNKWGTYKYDSEGTMGEKRVIVENGILKGFLHSLETSARMGVKPNGSARASGYSSIPIVRMSNTYIAPGTS
ncbi:MAG: TldD/PmbA family protein, partial [Armatimonadota bacterium]